MTDLSLVLFTTQPRLIQPLQEMWADLWTRREQMGCSITSLDRLSTSCQFNLILVWLNSIWILWFGLITQMWQAFHTIAYFTQNVVLCDERIGNLFQSLLLCPEEQLDLQTLISRWTYLLHTSDDFCSLSSLAMQAIFMVSWCPDLAVDFTYKGLLNFREWNIVQWCFWNPGYNLYLWTSAFFSQSQCAQN